MSGKVHTDLGYLKDIALHVAQQMPKNREEAVLVNEFVRELIEWRHAYAGAENVIPLASAAH